MWPLNNETNAVNQFDLIAADCHFIVTPHTCSTDDKLCVGGFTNSCGFLRVTVTLLMVSRGNAASHVENTSESNY